MEFIMFRTIVFLLGFFLSSCVSIPASGDTLEVNPDRTLKVQGVIKGAGLIKKADRLLALSEASDEDVYLVINSPGGQVLPGLQFISAMRIAQDRGTEIKCFVPMVAASVAFQIYAECDERYAFDYSLMLWHPMKVSVFMGSFTAEQLRAMARALESWEEPLKERLREKLDVDDETFEYYYRNGTLHLSSAIEDLDSSFLSLVDDVEGVKVRFSMKKRR